MQIKVAQVGMRYYPCVGGIITRIKMVSERLVKQGIHIEILAGDSSGKLPRQETINGVLVKRFKLWSYKGIYISPGIMYYLKKNFDRYNLIEVHNYHNFSTLYTVMIKGKSDCKLVLTPHYHGTRNIPSRIRRLLHIPYSFLWALFLDRVDKIICVSEEEKLLFCNDFNIPKGKILVIPNGAEIKAIQRAEPYSIDTKLILYVGQLVQYKNVHHIVKAMPYVPKDYIFYIVGDGPYKGNLLQLIKRLHLEDRVSLLSGLSDEQVYRWYKTCSVFVTLSSLEAFGITVLEALAAGKPVVASDIPAFRELSRKLRGIKLVKIPGTTSQELAQIIVQSAESVSPCNELDMFSWDSIAERVGQVYSQLLSKEV